MNRFSCDSGQSVLSLLDKTCILVELLKADLCDVVVVIQNELLTQFDFQFVEAILRELFKFPCLLRTERRLTELCEGC